MNLFYPGTQDEIPGLLNKKGVSLQKRSGAGFRGTSSLGPLHKFTLWAHAQDMRAHVSHCKLHIRLIRLIRPFLTPPRTHLCFSRGPRPYYVMLLAGVISPRIVTRDCHDPSPLKRFQLAASDGDNCDGAALHQHSHLSIFPTPTRVAFCGTFKENPLRTYDRSRATSKLASSAC